MRWIVPALLALLTTGAVAAAPQAPEPRVAPGRLSSQPSFVQRVEPAVVGIHVEVPPDRPSVRTLGAERWGSGVIVDQAGHILTVSYIVMDASEIKVSLRDGRVLPATLTGIDFESGLGVIRLEASGTWPLAVLGSSAAAHVGDGAAIVGVTEDNHVVVTLGTIRAIQSFAAYWEYLLEQAILVAPTNAAFGGSPLINTQGEVVGITSLRLGDPPQVNLAIPIDLFHTVKNTLLSTGRSGRPPRSWLGLSAFPVDEGVIVGRIGPVGPAGQAGLRPGDVIVRLNGEKVEGLEDFYRKLWRTTVGDEVKLTIRRQARFEVITVRPADRYQFYQTRGK